MRLDVGVAPCGLGLDELVVDVDVGGRGFLDVGCEQEPELLAAGDAWGCEGPAEGDLGLGELGELELGQAGPDVDEHG